VLGKFIEFYELLIYEFRLKSTQNIIMNSLGWKFIVIETLVEAVESKLLR
jgi:hypothetical protein